MSYVKWLCWSLRHAEQLLFSCLYSKVSVSNYVTCQMSHVTCLMSNGYVDPWDMLNNFCFHVYTQKWVFVIMSHVTCHMSHVTCHMSNAYVDPWDMLNNFCFHVYAQMLMFMGENDNGYFLTAATAAPLLSLLPILCRCNIARSL